MPTRARRARSTRGSGLGLAIVKGIVDAHGGTISVDSMLGLETVFTIRLPDLPLPAVEPAATQESAPVPD